MEVTVSRKGRLADRATGSAPATAELLSLVDGAVTTDLLAACEVDPRECIVVVNGAAVPHGSALSDGDRVQLYPAQAGG